MIRLILQIVIPLALPTVAYFAYVAFLRRRDENAEITIKKPWFRLIASGLILTMVSMAAFAIFTGEEPGGQYVPPTVVDGEIVPGHVKRDDVSDDEGQGDVPKESQKP